MFVIFLPLRVFFILCIAVFTVLLTIVQAASDILKIVIQDILIASLNVFSSTLEKLEHPTTLVRDFDETEAQFLLDRAEMRLAHAHTLEAGCDPS